MNRQELIDYIVENADRKWWVEIEEELKPSPTALLDRASDAQLKEWAGGLGYSEGVGSISPDEQRLLQMKARNRWGDDWKIHMPTSPSGGIDWAAAKFVMEE